VGEIVMTRPLDDANHAGFAANSAPPQRNIVSLGKSGFNAATLLATVAS
jgi:hypothetical protein